MSLFFVNGFFTVHATLDRGSNTSFISKNVKGKLGISGAKTHLTMNLAGGNKKSEESELINTSVVSTAEDHIQKSVRAYVINKPYSPARTVSRKKKKLLTQDMLGVKPTELCTCSNKDFKESRFIKSIAKSTQIIDGRVQVHMPWKDEVPPKDSNYDVA